MPKNSKPDNKTAREPKDGGQAPLSQENQNQNHNTKKEALGPNTKR